MRQVIDYISYLLIRLVLLPFAIMPLLWIHKVGKAIGSLLFYTLKTFRKKTLSNLALVKGIAKDEAQLLSLAKQSFQNLAITMLEYGKLPFISDINSIVSCDNVDTALSIIQSGKGLIFFVGHQANWELLFLQGTSIMPGVAIGRPIKNRFLYRYVVRMRERFGGTIFPPQKALKEGLRALKAGKFLGIVGDQAFPSGTFTSNFLGVNAYTSTAPALLSYKTGAPIITASIWREKGRYKMRYSDPIYPNQKADMNKEVERMMHYCLAYLEKSIRLRPGQWLWQHNRWKQEPATITYYRFRKNPILVILPRDKHLALKLTPVLKLLRAIYPKAFLTLWAPKEVVDAPEFKTWQIRPYSGVHELFIKDYSFQLVFNFSDIAGIKPHFLSLSAHDVIDKSMLETFAEKEGINKDDLEIALAKLITRKGEVHLHAN